MFDDSDDPAVSTPLKEAAGLLAVKPAPAAGVTAPTGALGGPDTADDLVRMVGSLQVDVAAMRESLADLQALRAEADALRVELGRRRSTQRPPEILRLSAVRPIAYDGSAVVATMTGDASEARTGGEDHSGWLIVRLARRLKRILGGGAGDRGGATASHADHDDDFS